MCANPYHDIVESYPIDDIESDVLLNAPRLYSTAPKEEKDNEKRFLWNEWTQSNGFFQIMYERFHVPSLLHQEKHQVRNQLPDIEFHLGQNVFDRLLPVSLLEKIIDQISGKQIIYDKLEAETPDCIVLWRNQKFHLQFSNLKVQKLMITGLTRNMPYYVFDEGQEWKIGFKKQQKRRLFHKLFRKNRQPKNHFVGNRRQDLNRYLKMQGDKAQIAIRGLNFVLTGHSSIR